MKDSSNNSTPPSWFRKQIGIWEYDQEFDPGRYSFQSLDADKENGIGAEIYVCTDGEVCEVLIFEHQWEGGSAETWGIFDTVQEAFSALVELEYPTTSANSSTPIRNTELLQEGG
ncbi:hypothetical protein ACLI4Y_13140 [Natrialbaceae archaeon A-CW3]